jgi:tetratricopeptide (TPR) repeat protein
MGLGQYDECLHYLESALRAQPNVRDALIYKGMALYLSGRQEEAMDIEAFRTEFVGRFKDELRKKMDPSPQ